MQPAMIADNTLSASHMEKTIHLLRSRLQSRLSLHKQFASLGTCTFYLQHVSFSSDISYLVIHCLIFIEHGIIPISGDCQNLFPAKVVSRLTKWNVIPYEDYMVSEEWLYLPYVDRML